MIDLWLLDSLLMIDSKLINGLWLINDWLMIDWLMIEYLLINVDKPGTNGFNIYEQRQNLITKMF